MAVTLVAEMGDLTWCESPRELMKFMGGDPLRIFLRCAPPPGGDYQGRQHPCATRPRRRRLGLPFSAKVSRHLPLRLATHPKVIQDIRWKAQIQLCKRSRRLVSRGKHANVVTVAIARELIGFMWAIAKEGPIVA